MTMVAWVRERSCQVAIRTVAMVVALACVGIVLTLDKANAWPERTVRLITPGAAGSHTDAIARILAEGLGKKWGHPVIVENRPGADGILAVRNFLTGRDEHSLLYSFNSIVTVNPALHEKLPYDPKVDLIPILHVVEDFIAIVASPDLPVATLAELQILMSAKPGSLNYASFPGSPYLAFAAFQERLGADMTFVPYQALTSVLPDIMENRIHIGVLSLAMVNGLAQNGKLKILALASSRRAPIAPDMPTASEAGFPELLVVGGHGLFARTSMSLELRDQIVRDVREVMSQPPAAERVTTLGFVLRLSGSAEHQAFLDVETERVAALVRKLGPKARARVIQ